jgi:glycosyltransferase involved in cell wall biosynthesis
MKTKICHVVSDVDYSQLFDTVERFLNKEKYELSFVFIGQKLPLLHQIFESRGCPVFFVEYQNRKDLFLSVGKLSKIFGEIKPDIVHTHFANASLAGLVAAKISGVNRRIHTRHHSTECHIYYRHAVYYDKLINLLSTKIVAISRVVRDVLVERENVSPKKIEIIWHGFDFDTFAANRQASGEVKKLYNLSGNYPVVGVISRFVHWKGIQHIIPAFAKLIKIYPQAKLVLANAATGSYSEEIRELLREHLSESQYVLISFEKRVIELYDNFDIFVHVPVDRESEAFGLIYVEALAMRVPSVFTLSGVANDFIEDKVNALVVPHNDSEAIFKAMRLFLENAELRQKIIEKGRTDASELFQAEKMAAKFDALYASVL